VFPHRGTLYFYSSSGFSTAVLYLTTLQILIFLGHKPMRRSYVYIFLSIFYTSSSESVRSILRQIFSAQRNGAALFLERCVNIAVIPTHSSADNFAYFCHSRYERISLQFLCRLNVYKQLRLYFIFL